jgi:hypothetical protein
MISDFEFFNDEWNKADIENSNPILPGMERGIEDTAPSQE